MATKTSKHCSEPLSNVLNYLSGKYVLPSFQRDFVWKMEQIEDLFNSILSGYPFGTMLFWHITSTGQLAQEPFYRFLQHYHEDKITQAAQKVSLLPDHDYWVVLDGQQRLTSLFIGLTGSYKKRAKYQRKGNCAIYPEYKLYVLVSKKVANPFKFITTDETGGNQCFVDKNGEKWILVNTIFFATKSRDLVKTYKLNELEEDRVDDFKKAIDSLSIEYSEITGFTYNEATDVFVKVNSGGTILEMSDILNSIIVSTWKKVNAKEEFKNLTERISKHGFYISTNYIVKAILFLFNESVKFQIQGFSSFISDPIKDIEGKWKDLCDSVENTFDLLQSFGLNHASIGGYNVTLPILYYIYHKSIKNPANSVNFNNDRPEVKKWILSAILIRIFAHSSDSVLTKIRHAFTDDFNQYYINKTVTHFPAQDIKKCLNDDWYISEDKIREFLRTTRKGDRYSIPLLSLLFPDVNYQSTAFEQDHLHPMARYKFMPLKFTQDKDNRKLYDSIVNLQWLEKSENVIKSNNPLEQWVSDKCKSMNQAVKNQWLGQRFLDGLSLKENDIATFLKERENKLTSFLLNII